MTETNQPKTNFAGTYFDRDSILKLAKFANISAWAILGFSILQIGLSVGIFTLQIIRGLYTPMGFTDVFQQVVWFFQPITPGLLYFVGIQAIGKALLIFMDVEDNLRRIARNK
jgi:hypothetical protein